MRRAVGPGAEPYSSGRPRTMGKMMPPLRPVFEGVKGASARSVSAMA